MPITEKEAKTKLCGMAMSGQTDILCQGSTCMGWRPLGVQRFAGPNQEDVLTGYCGHAGAPHDHR